MAVDVNPYAAPASTVEQITGDHGEPTIFSFESRAGRVRYLLRYMIASIVAYIVFSFGLAIVALISIGSLTEPNLDAFAGPAIFIPVVVVGAAWLVITSMFAIQRLHDLGWTGWLCLLRVVPFVNIVFGLYLLFAPGTRGPNSYGMAPPPNGLGVTLTTGILLFFCIAFFALIAVLVAVQVV